MSIGLAVIPDTTVPMQSGRYTRYYCTDAVWPLYQILKNEGIGFSLINIISAHIKLSNDV